MVSLTILRSSKVKLSETEQNFPVNKLIWCFVSLNPDQFIGLSRNTPANIIDNNIEYSTSRIVYIIKSNMKLFQKNKRLRLWHKLLTLRFVKVTQGYMNLKKGRGFNDPPYIKDWNYPTCTLSHIEQQQKNSHIYDCIIIKIQLRCITVFCTAFITIFIQQF